MASALSGSRKSRCIMPLESYRSRKSPIDSFDQARFCLWQPIRGKQGAAMWTDEQRKVHKPRVGRYPSDVTDEEWAIIGPMIPPARTGGRKRQTDVREVFNAIRYVDRTGCQWRQL